MSRPASPAAHDWVEVRRRMQQADAAIQEALAPSPARARAIMDARAHALAQPPAAEAARGTRLDLVLFRLGAERYAIETAYVHEVVRLGEITPVPGTPDAVAGVTGLHGSILAVMDVRLLLGVGRREATDASRLIVLGAGAPELGVIADATDGQAGLDATEVLDPADTVGVRHPWIRGTTRDALVILDGDLLLKDERLNAGRADRHS